MANGDEQLGLLGRVGQAFSGGSQFSPLLSLGAGLLSASGPSATPTSFGQRLGQGLGAAGQFQEQMARNQLLRQRMQERADQREARQKLFQSQGFDVNTGMLPTPDQIISGQDVGDLSGVIQERPTAIQGLLSGQVTPQNLGLFAEAFPDQTGQLVGGLLGGDQRAEPSAVRTLRAAGIDPQSEQGREVLLQNLTGGALDAEIQNLKAQQQLLDLRQQMGEMSREQRERTQERAMTATGIKSDLKSVNRLRDLTQSLEGTIAETGLPLQEARRALASLSSVTPDSVANALNIDRDQARQVAANIQEFEKLSNDLALKRASRMFGGDITDNKLNFVTTTMPNPEMGPDANRRILDSLEAELNSFAQNQGVELEESRERRTPGNQGRISPRRIQQMPRAEFESLDLDAITARDQRRAVDQRARDLGLIGPDQSLF